MSHLIETAMPGFVLPVFDCKSPAGQNTIGFHMIDGKVVVTVTKGDSGLCAVLAGDAIDLAAQLFANTVFAANAHSLGQSGGTVQ